MKSAHATRALGIDSLGRANSLYAALLVGLAVTLLPAVSVNAADEPYRPVSGSFPSLSKAVSHRGELVFVDHVNRRGSLRLHVDGHFREAPPHHFAMLPYGVIRYRGAPAELRDIPIGTVLYGGFFLPPDPKVSAVPVIQNAKPGKPRETHAILLEDGPSLCLREGKTWKLREVEINGASGHLIASLKRPDGGDGLGGEHKITIDGSTRIWRGKELLGLADLVAEKTWPGSGKRAFKDLPIHLGLTWHDRYLYQQFHAADVWLDETAIQVAGERQRQIHIRHIRHRWMPAWVDSVEHGEFGDAIVTATLFGGMAASLYADFKPGVGGQMCVAEDTLRTYWPNHDGMEGRFLSVEKVVEQPPMGSSGIQIKMEMNLVLEGFRPGRIVRVRPNNWPKVKPPKEELIDGLESRWPSPAVFQN